MSTTSASTTDVQTYKGHDWFHLVMAIIIGVSPWLKGFTGGPTATRFAIITAIVVAALAVISLLRNIEWTQWGLAAAGLWTLALPFILKVPPAAGNYKTWLLGGGLLAASALWKIWRLRNPS